VIEAELAHENYGIAGKLDEISESRFVRKLRLQTEIVRIVVDVFSL